MSNTVLHNVQQRYIKAAQVLKLEDHILDELLGFKMRLSFDMEANVGGKPKRLKAVRVWHRAPLTRFAFKGGIRFLKGTTLTSLESHAAEMSIKCWMHSLPYGGAKGGIDLNPTECSAEELEKIAYKFVDELDERNAIGPFLDVPAPDVGTNGRVMFHMAERYSYRHRGQPYSNGVVTGKPVDEGFEYVGGIKGRNEATGYGANIALSELRKEEYGLFAFGDHPRMIIQGFGNVGMHAALFAQRAGYRIIGVADAFGGIYNENGIDTLGLYNYWKGEAPPSVKGFPGASPMEWKDLLSMPCEVLVPAALEEVITEENADKVRTKVILEGANGPTTPEADKILESRGIVVIPDIYANSGGVTVSYFEWGRNTDQTDPRIPRENDARPVLSAMEQMIRKAGSAIVKRSHKYGISLREAAYVLALEKAELLRARRMPEYAKKLFG